MGGPEDRIPDLSPKFGDHTVTIRQDGVPTSVSVSSNWSPSSLVLVDTASIPVVV